MTAAQEKWREHGKLLQQLIQSDPKESLGLAAALVATAITAAGLEIEAARLEERDRIRQELEDWLIGRVDPRDAGLVNGRRIVTEIDRICSRGE